MDLKQALILIFAGIGGTLGFSLIFRMRKKLIVWSLLGAALTLGVYVLCLATMQHAFFQNLFPALAGALFAEVTAKLTKSPATQYLACAIIPLVPGGGLYYTMYHFVTGDMEIAVERSVALQDKRPCAALAETVGGAGSRVRLREGAVYRSRGAVGHIEIAV